MTTPRPQKRLAASSAIGPEQTEGDIKKYLRSRGADQLVTAEDADRGQIVVMFRLFGRVIQMRQALAHADSQYIQRPASINQFAAKPAGSAVIAQRLESERRRRWRVMLTRVKVRLDLVFDEEDQDEREAAFRYEFLGDTALPGGGTVREFMEPQVAEAYKSGRQPQTLPAPKIFRPLEGETGGE